MKIRFLLPFVLLLIAAQDSQIAITTPTAGDVLRGEVTIIGTTDSPDFFSGQLDFAYASDSTGNWFTLQVFSQPAVNAPLFVWDTTAITDGEYRLRLRVSSTDGTFEEVIIPVSIQNDVILPTPTPVPTPTPDSVTVQIPTPFLLAASPTPTEIPRPTPSPLPANPAALDQIAIVTSLGRGALVIVGFFILAGLILRLRRS